MGLETFLGAGGEAALAEACGGGLEVRGVVERVALTLALLGGSCGDVCIGNGCSQGGAGRGG